MKTMAQERVKAEMLGRLRALHPDTPRRWGRMSAHQMVCHLSDSARIALGQRVASPATGVAERTIVKWIALWLPLRWPVGIKTRPEVDQEAGGTCPSDFLADVAELVALTEAITVERRGSEWAAPHPIFGRMSEAEWLRWAYLHMDHHLRQFGL